MRQLVLMALGLGEPRLWPKLGGAKPACLGTIEVIKPILHVFHGREAYVDFDREAQTEPIQSYLQAAQPLLQLQQLRKLAEILRWPREDRECPDRNY